MKIDTNLMRVGSIKVGDKYEILTFDDAREMCERPREDGKGVKLYRVRALKDFGEIKKGELGGYIEEISCLSAEGNCWIGRNCSAYAGSRISGDAIVEGNVELYGKTIVENNAVVIGRIIAIDCNFSHNAVVGGKLMLLHCVALCEAKITGDGAAQYAVVHGNDKIVVNGFSYTQSP